LQLFLVCVFALAGVLKFRDPVGTRDMLVAFGLSKSLAAGLAVAIPIFEILIAAALCWPDTALHGAIGSVVLLFVFSAAIAWNLYQGRTPACNCFGQTQPKPISNVTLLRNGLLLVIAVLVVSGTHYQTDAKFWDMINQLSHDNVFITTMVIGVLLLLGLCVICIIQLMIQQGRVLARLDALEHPTLASTVTSQSRPNGVFAPGLPLGSVAPDFQLVNLAGMEVKLDSLFSARRSLVLIFLSPNCGPCTSLIPEISQWMSADKAYSVAVISDGSVDEVKEKCTVLDNRRTLLQPDRSVSTAFKAWGTPAAVVIDSGGKIASLVAQGTDSIRMLIEDLQEKSIANKPPLQVNELVSRINITQSKKEHGLELNLNASDKLPVADFPSAEGGTIRLSDYKGHPLLLLFWNPDCGYCKQMLPRLRTWEISTTPDDPQVLVVSSAEYVERAHLQSMIVFDEKSMLAKLFGATGTPMSIRFDAAGKVTSEVVAGAEAFFELAQR
jgi:peroxiredoxin